MMTKLKLEDFLQTKDLEAIYQANKAQKKIKYRTTGVQDTIYRELNIDPNKDPITEIGRLLRLPADLTTAEKISQLDTINTFDSRTKKIKKIPLCGSEIEFFAGKYGLCIWYYFSFLKYLTIQLFIMFL